MSKKNLNSKSVSPRKEPKQDRSESLVGIVLEAATRILAKSGYAKLTTNYVAEIAGVSIGSLYQYFPNKQALVARLIERHVSLLAREIESNLVDKFKDGKKPSIEDTIDVTVASIVTQYMKNKILYRSLFEKAPEVDRISYVLQMRRESIQLISSRLSDWKDQLKDGDFADKSYIISNAVMGVLLVAGLDDELQMSSDSIAFELSQLVKSYLLKSPV
jgi:AcrR family transcriptional regulator